MPRPFGPILATRTLSRTIAGGRAVVIRIGKPRRAPSGDWECPYQILGVGSGRPRRALGLDPIQALLLTFVGIRYDLKRTGAALTWLGEPGDLGLPALVPDGFGVEVAQHLEQLVSNEVTRIVRSARHPVRSLASGRLLRRPGRSPAA